jgi:hypothetical protein
MTHVNSRRELATLRPTEGAAAKPRTVTLSCLSSYVNHDSLPPQNHISTRGDDKTTIGTRELK